MNWQQNTTTALWISAFFIFIGFQIFVALMVWDASPIRWSMTTPIGGSRRSNGG